MTLGEGGRSDTAPLCLTRPLSLRCLSPHRRYLVRVVTRCLTERVAVDEDPTVPHPGPADVSLSAARVSFRLW